MTRQSLFGTKRQLAAMLSLSERRVTQLVAAKILPPRGARGFDLEASVQGYIAFLKTEPNTLKTERLRLAKVKADILELQLQERTGKLVLRSAVEKAVFDMTRRSRDAMKNIPDRLAGIVAAERDQGTIHALLTKEIQQALEGLSR